MSKDIDEKAAELSRIYAANLANLYPNTHELSAAIAATIGTFIMVHEMDPHEVVHDIMSGIMHLVEIGEIKENPFITKMVHPGVTTIQ